MTSPSNEFMKSVLKKVKEKRERVHKQCLKILGDSGNNRMFVKKLLCSSKDTHL